MQMSLKKGGDGATSGRADWIEIVITLHGKKRKLGEKKEIRPYTLPPCPPRFFIHSVGIVCCVWISCCSSLMGKDGAEKDRWWSSIKSDRLLGQSLLSAFEAIQSPVHFKSMRKWKRRKTKMSFVPIGVLQLFACRHQNVYSSRSSSSSSNNSSRIGNAHRDS